MNLEVFGVIIARLHPDYIVFYLAIIVGAILLLVNERRQRMIQKRVNEVWYRVFMMHKDYIERMKEAKDS